jgi:hypothetical protein
MDIEAIIREVFKASGWSMKRLADTSGLHYASVHRFVVSGKPIMAQTASMMCMALGLELRPVKQRKEGR